MAEAPPVSGLSDEAARLIYKEYLLRNYTRDGRISRKGIENVKDFLLEYGLMSRDRAPRVDDMYTNNFLGG